MSTMTTREDVVAAVAPLPPPAVRTLLASWRLIAIVTLIATVLPKTYRADTITLPTMDEYGGTGEMMNSMLSQFGGLASLVGLPGAASTLKTETIATLESASLFRSHQVP